MVIKTDLCSYTEYRVYPGGGQKFVAKDGKVSFFISKKAESLFHQRIKPVKLRWTQAWRRMNKKGTANEQVKKRTRKVQKFQKAIVGMSLDDIKKKKAQKPELRAEAKEAAAKESKARAQKKAAAKPTAKAGAAKAKAQVAKQPKGGAGGGKKDFKSKK
uniref:Large ribosomal subunit protein eL24-related N-terminal domain-containing protein n=1 Tax=Alexandrium andersonii TaxID=327968 RepID=A0A6U6MZP8_9DINO|mmetsp:Transcript_36376/g.82747  ORF Transcript_36376/g.82747 Transcript_36376/m.82747 type:complete len:159 (+) Transcript_36376:98-574(+)